MGQHEGMGEVALGKILHKHGYGLRIEKLNSAWVNMDFITSCQILYELRPLVLALFVLS